MVLKVNRFQKRAFLLTVHGVNWHRHRRNRRIYAKQKQTKWCLVPKILFYLKFFVKKKVTTI